MANDTLTYNWFRRNKFNTLVPDLRSRWSRPKEHPASYCGSGPVLPPAGRTQVDRPLVALSWQIYILKTDRPNPNNKYQGLDWELLRDLEPLTRSFPFLSMYLTQVFSLPSSFAFDQTQILRFGILFAIWCVFDWPSGCKHLVFPSWTFATAHLPRSWTQSCLQKTTSQSKDFRLKSQTTWQNYALLHTSVGLWHQCPQEPMLNETHQRQPFSISFKILALGCSHSLCPNKHARFPQRNNFRLVSLIKLCSFD